jgi:hypothetical protein
LRKKEVIGNLLDRGAEILSPKMLINIYISKEARNIVSGVFKSAEW